MNAIKIWFQTRFGNTELIILIALTLFFTLLILIAGRLLAPILASIIFAYLLEGSVKRLEAWRFPHWLAVSLVFVVFMGAIFAALFVLLPLLWQQLSNLYSELPNMVQKGQQFFDGLSRHYPSYISKQNIQHLMATYQADFGNIGKAFLNYSLSTISSVMSLIVYLILVPIIVFLLMLDREPILNWCKQFLPGKRKLVVKVWREINQQMGNYIRAKVLEMFLVAVASTITFALLGLNYAVLLGVLVGVATLVPYVGAIVVTIPVVIIGFMQWGIGSQFVYLIIAYTIINVLDGNVLTPILFSETLKLHPVAVIIAVIIFGGLWGFWGVFFSIPLAIVVKALLNAWFSSNHSSALE